MSRLILLRHGKSVWNQKNLFTGWVDIPLNSEGVQEALRAGEQICDLPIDLIFVSSLIRSQMTAMLAMSLHKGGRTPVVLHSEEGKQQEWSKIHSSRALEETIPVVEAWQLNERMYGKLQGLNKEETAQKYGAEQVHIWRRSYDVAPPDGECLADTAARTIPYFEEKILPCLEAGKNVLVVAHGNSLRSIVMRLDRLSREEVVKLELETGVPLFYRIEGRKIERDSHG